MSGGPGAAQALHVTEAALAAPLTKVVALLAVLLVVLLATATRVASPTIASLITISLLVRCRRRRRLVGLAHHVDQVAPVVHDERGCSSSSSSAHMWVQGSPSAEHSAQREAGAGGGSQAVRNVDGQASPAAPCRSSTCPPSSSSAVQRTKGAIENLLRRGHRLLHALVPRGPARQLGAARQGGGVRQDQAAVCACVCVCGGTCRDTAARTLRRHGRLRRQRAARCSHSRVHASFFASQLALQARQRHQLLADRPAALRGCVCGTGA